MFCRLTKKGSKLGLSPSARASSAIFGRKMVLWAGTRGHGSKWLDAAIAPLRRRLGCMEAGKGITLILVF
jgi:hypothetical protein